MGRYIFLKCICLNFIFFFQINLFVYINGHISFYLLYENKVSNDTGFDKNYKCTEIINVRS
jgi:hypothetical protein